MACSFFIVYHNTSTDNQEDQMAKKKTQKNNLRVERISEEMLTPENHPLNKHKDAIAEVNSVSFGELFEREVGKTREHFKGIVLITSVHESMEKGKRICLMDICDLDGFQRVMMTEVIYPKFSNFVSAGKIVYFSGTIIEDGGIRFMVPESMELYPRNIVLETPKANNSAGRVKAAVKQRAKSSPEFMNTVKKGELIESKVEEVSFIEFISKQVREQFNISDMDLTAQIESNLKDYMNADELKNFMWLFITAGYSDYYLTQSVAHGNITSEEFDALEGAMEGLKKYVGLRMARTDEKTNKRIEKKTYDGEVRLFDKFMINKMRVATEDVLENVLLERAEFEDFAEIVMRQNCRNCKMNHQECSLNDILNDNLMPESGKQLDNCPYAYVDNDTEQAINTHIRALREMRRDRSSIGEKYKKDSGMSLEFMSDMAALNKGIEALIRIKNGEVKENGE